MKGSEVDMLKLLWEKEFPTDASHLERQYQLRAGLYSGGGLSSYARREDQFSATSFQRSQPDQIQKSGGSGLERKFQPTKS